MPSANEVKNYKKDSVYHVYNRGVNKQETFFNSLDYKIFINIAKSTMKEMRQADMGVEIIAYSLLPNHFHFILWQKGERDMVYFMKKLILKYVVYINRTHNRSGNLFVRPYKARLLQSPRDMSLTVKYVLDNPKEANLPDSWEYVGLKL